MALELRQSLSFSQQLVMTPQLQQAISLPFVAARAPAGGAEELEVNPALEETSEETSEETAEEESAAAGGGVHTPDPGGGAHAEGRRRGSSTAWTGSTTSTKGPATDAWIGTPTTKTDVPTTRTPSRAVPDSPSTSSDAAGSWTSPTPSGEVALYLVGNIDENGYLKTTAEEAAQALSLPVEEVERAIARVQTLDPLGVGAGPAGVPDDPGAGKGRGVRTSPPDPRGPLRPVLQGDVAGAARRLSFPKEVVKEAFQRLVPCGRSPAANTRETTSSTSPPTSTCSRSTINGSSP